MYLQKIVFLIALSLCQPSQQATAVSFKVFMIRGRVKGSTMVSHLRQNLQVLVLWGLFYKLNQPIFYGESAEPYEMLSFE